MSGFVSGRTSFGRPIVHPADGGNVPPLLRIPELAARPVYPDPSHRIPAGVLDRLRRRERRMLDAVIAARQAEVVHLTRSKGYTLDTRTGEEYRINPHRIEEYFRLSESGVLVDTGPVVEQVPGGEWEIATAVLAAIEDARHARTRRAAKTALDTIRRLERNQPLVLALLVPADERDDSRAMLVALRAELGKAGRGDGWRRLLAESFEWRMPRDVVRALVRAVAATVDAEP